MPSMDGPGNRKMFEKFTGDKEGEWKVSNNTVVSVSPDVRCIRLHGHEIVWWKFPSLRFCACGWATQTTTRKLNYMMYALAEKGIIAQRMGLRINKGGLVLYYDGKDIEVDANAHIFLRGINTFNASNLSAYLDIDGFYKPRKSLRIFPSLTFNQMKGVL